jgi:FMN phosphatase YigB (HAD superfamily)
MTRAAKSAVDWDCIDTVLVDMDGTLLDLSFDNLFWLQIVPETYARARGLTVPDAQAALAPRFTAKAGTLEWYCLDHWTRDLGIDLKTLKRETASTSGSCRARRNSWRARAPAANG